MGIIITISIIIIVIVIIIQMKNDRINFRFLGNCPATPPLTFSPK